MNAEAVVRFVAGDSRRGPLATLLGVALAAVLARLPGVPSVVAGVTLFAAVVLGLVASVFERV